MKQHLFRLPWWCWNVLTLLVLSGWATAKAPALQLIQTVDLKGPAGRLDHLALDANHGWLFVANMANSSLDVVDLKAGKLVRQIPGQKGIQGIAYAADLDRIFVGNGVGAACNVFDGKDFKLLKSMPLEDADNVRYQPKTHRVYGAHAEKALAVIDARTSRLRKDIKLPGQPEAFQLETARPRLYLNIPSVSGVVVISTKKNKILRRYTLKGSGANYPLALDEANCRVFVGCRKNPAVLVLDCNSGKQVASVPIPGDVDDLFFDAQRKRLYASCGEGSVAVLRQKGKNRYELLEKVPAPKGTRTCLYDAAMGRLYLVVPRQPNKEGPEIRVYQAS
jgi:DNA-binding beta-propeller fold protein YncE